jgi:hypothetical protein
MPTKAKNKKTKKKKAALRAIGLTDDLAAFFQYSGASQMGPVVLLENRIAQTKSVHLVVIWDAWKDLSPTDRSKVILDASARAKRAPGATITVAMGLTSEEALRMGFLPYSIVTNWRQGDNVSVGELETAMGGAGGVMVRVGSSTQLRFATLEQAEDAYRYLSQKVSGPYWAIVQDTSNSAGQ